MALAPSLAQLNVAMLNIANLSNRGQAILPYQTFFTRGQSHRGIVLVFFGQQLS
jgi:hypothetical protein